MAGQLEAAGLAQFVAIDLEYREVLVDEIADIEVTAVGAEYGAFGKRADIVFAGEADFLAVDPQHADRTRRMVEPGILREVRALRVDRDGDVALGAEDQPFRRVGDGDVVDDAGRVGLEI